MFTENDLQNFSQYVSKNKYSYLHFGASRVGLAPLFRQAINTPCRAELFDTRHKNYEHAQIGTINGNLSKNKDTTITS